MSNNIVLVGPMGAGKTTIGRLLAARLGFEFVDTDNLIEERTGADIPWIFDVEGEEGFRQRETAVLDDLVERDSVVIATGGGIVMRPENLSKLKRLGQIVYITADVEQLYERTSKDRKRPLLQVDNPKARIRELLALRDPIYREVADHIIVTDGRSTKVVVQGVLQLLGIASHNISSRHSV